MSLGIEFGIADDANRTGDLIECLTGNFKQAGPEVTRDPVVRYRSDQPVIEHRLVESITAAGMMFHSESQPATTISRRQLGSDLGIGCYF